MGQNDSSLAEKRRKPVPADGGTAVRKKTSGGKKAAAGKKTPAKKRPADGRKASDGRRTAAGKRTDSGRKTPAGKKSSSRERTAAEGRASRERTEPRMNRRDAERARRKAERERKVKRQKTVMAVSLCVILLSVIGIVVFCLPSVKLTFRMFQGDRAAAKEDYAGAQAAYEKVLEIDPASVKAYRCLADNYRIQQMMPEAEQILYTGWEKTQNENLLKYYCTVVLNQAVAEINDRNCTLATVDKCIRALEYGATDTEALDLLGTCYKRLFKAEGESDTCTLFFDEDISQDTCSYGEYEQMVRRMLAVYQARPSETLKGLLSQYAMIDMPRLRISMPHLDSYSALLTEVNGALNDAGIAETIACLARAKEITAYFNTAFDEFAAGNYAYARDLISEEAYQQIRDDFIAGNSGYWEGSTYIPVSREQLELHREEGSVRFSFLSDEDYENRQGIITVWGTQQEDDGVLRSVISYKPAGEAGTGSPTEYTVQYLYSNVKINGKYVPQMNYRFDTRTVTDEGVVTNAIGDWGGENEWEIDY